MNSAMKIVFLVSSSKKGLGGHHYSVRDLVISAKGHYQAKAILLGGSDNPAFHALEDRYRYFRIDEGHIVNVIRAIRYIRALSEDEGCHFIAFDHFSLSILRFALYSSSGSYALCKPGGRDWPIRTKTLPALFLFSHENLNYIKDKQPHLYRKSHVIEARVRKVNSLVPVERRDVFPEEIYKSFKIFCVARFSPEKLPIFRAGIRFLEFAKLYKGNASLCIIGIPKEPDVVAEVKRLKEESTCAKSIYLFDTPDFYQNVSDLFPLADVLVGNARTLMEGMSVGVPALVGTVGRDLPILVTSNNLDKLAKVNLSSRLMLEDDEYKDNVNSITQLLTVSKQYDSFCEEMRRLFMERYDVEISHRIIYETFKILEHERPTTHFEWNDLRMFLGGLSTIIFSGRKR